MGTCSVAFGWRASMPAQTTLKPKTLFCIELTMCEILARCPHIVKVYGHQGPKHAPRSLIMELCDGGLSQECCGLRNPILDDQCILVVEQPLNALVRLQECGLCHRNLTTFSDNILCGTRQNGCRFDAVTADLSSRPQVRYHAVHTS